MPSTTSILSYLVHHPASHPDSNILHTPEHHIAMYNNKIDNRLRMSDEREANYSTSKTTTEQCSNVFFLFCFFFACRTIIWNTAFAASNKWFHKLENYLSLKMVRPEWEGREWVSIIYPVNHIIDFRWYWILEIFSFFSLFRLPVVWLSCCVFTMQMSRFCLDNKNHKISNF